MYDKKVSKHLWALQFMHFFTCVAQFYAQTERHSSFEILKNCLKLILIIHEVNMFPWDIFGLHSLDRRYVTESVMECLKKPMTANWIFIIELQCVNCLFTILQSCVT